MSEDEWVGAFAVNEWAGWPGTPLIITAVDAESGAFKTFDRHSGVELERAVAASCSVPGMFPVVTIDGHRYTDGGVRSGTSADIAQQIEPDIVLMIAPMGASDRGVNRLAAKQIVHEKTALETAGAQVRVVQFDDAAKQAGGQNLMDPTLRAGAADAGEAHGRRLARELGAWWRGA
jgi:NTE family protein